MKHTPAAPLTAADVTLNNADQARFDLVRPLKDYRLGYINGQYPVLSFMFAAFAGGERILYCDHPNDFAVAYLIDSVPPEKRALALENAGKIGQALARVAAEREKMRDLPPAQQTIPRPTSAEWDQILAVLKAELQQPNPVPPPPPMW
jgi:hypothetical protein